MRRLLALSLVVLSLLVLSLLGPLLVLPTPLATPLATLLAGPASADPPPFAVGPLESLGAYNGVTPQVATDAYGRSTAAWVEQDRTTQGPIDNALWRVTTGTRGPGETVWTGGGWVSSRGAIATYGNESNANNSYLGDSPRIALRVLASGRAVVAWVQTIDGQRRVQVSVNQGYRTAFGPPVTLATSCANPPDMYGLTMQLDAEGNGYLSWLEQCSMFPRIVVPILGGLPSGTPYKLSPFTNNTSSPMWVQNGSVWLLGRQADSSYDLVGYALGASQATAHRRVVSADYMSTGNGFDSVLQPDGNLLTAYVDQGVLTVDTNHGGDDDPVSPDRVKIGASSGYTAVTPRIAVAPDGSALVAWLANGGIFGSVRPKGGVWSAPQQLNDPVQGNVISGSAKVAMNAEGAGYVVWSNQKLQQSPNIYDVEGAVVGPVVAGDSASQQFSEHAPVLEAAIWPQLSVLPDGRARVVAQGGGYGTLTYARAVLMGDATSTNPSAPPPTGPPTSPPAPPPDLTGPAITGLDLGTAAMAPGSRLGKKVLAKRERSVSGRTYGFELRTGTTFTWDQSEAGTVTVLVTEAGCASTRLLGDPAPKLIRCVRKKQRDAVFQQTVSASAGRNSFVWLGTPAARSSRLAAGGRYTVVVAGVDLSANHGNTASGTLVIDGAVKKT